MLGLGARLPRTPSTPIIGPLSKPSTADRAERPRFVHGLQDKLTCCDLDFTTRGPFPCPRGGSNVHLLGRFGAEDIYQLPDMSVYRPHSNGFGIAQGLTATNPLSEKTWLRTRSLHPGFSFSAADKRPTNDWSRTDGSVGRPRWVERMGQTTAERGLSPRIQQRKKAFPDKAAFPERYRTGTPLKAHASPSIGPGYRCQSPPKWPEPRGTYEGVPRSPRRKAFGSTRSEGFGSTSTASSSSSALLSQGFGMVSP